MSGQFKAFVSEEEVAEQRQKRQAEWEKVRNPDDPIECPEEETRSLFDQLQANKDLREREFEEEQKLRSSVKGLDEEEVQFLDYVSNRQIQIEKDRNREEKALLEELKNASVLKVQEKGKDKSSAPSTNKGSSSSATGQGSSSANKATQKQLLAGAIKRKSSTEVTVEPETKLKKADIDEEDDVKLMAGIPTNTGQTMLVAGILPGIGDYEDSDSSTENESNSSDSEADHMIVPSIPTQRLIQQMMQALKEESCG